MLLVTVLQELRVARRAMCDVAPQLVFPDLRPGCNFTDRSVAGAAFTIWIRVVTQDGLLNSIRHAVVFLLRSLIHLIYAPQFSVPFTTDCMNQRRPASAHTSADAASSALLVCKNTLLRLP